jgi:hypothetical protein
MPAEVTDHSLERRPMLIEVPLMGSDEDYRGFRFGE